MNWSLIAMMALVLLVVAVIGITIILFIRHWANRALGKTDQPNHEGIYFVRYVPPNKQALQPAIAPLTRRDHRKPVQYLLSGLFGAGLIGLMGASAYLNRDKMAAPIDLSQQELAAISGTQHNWFYKDFQQLPVLENYLSDFKAAGKSLILVNTDTGKKWPVHTGDFARQGEKHWLEFAKQHQLKTKTCAWKQLKRCGKSANNPLYIFLPGHWDNEGIRRFAESGKQILLYGPPQQVLVDPSAGFTIAGLTFKGGLTPGQPGLALRGDAELTLDFDAGLIIKAPPSFKHFLAESTYPQAVAINDQQMAGGSMSTRLYAHAYKNGGRMVWMDFSPNPQDHSKAVPYYLNTTIAAIFRYMGGKPYSAWSVWPEGKKFAALLEQDTEDQYHNSQQVAEYFQQNNYPITWFILSNEALGHRDLTRLLADTGELACHGDNHMDFPRNSLSVQQQRIARCIKVSHTLTGATVKAFRPPREKYNQDTLSAMYNNGIRYFIAETGTDRFTPVVYGNAKDEAALISLPRMNIDDYTLWGTLNTSDITSATQLQQEVDWVKRIGGLFMFSFHTQFMGSSAHLQTVKDLADYIADNNAYFATSGKIAEWWRLRILLKQNSQQAPDALLREYQPVLLSVNAAGKLVRKTIRTAANIARINQEE